MELIEFMYRREMGYTPDEVDALPTDVFERDLMFMQREGMARKMMAEG